MKRKTDHSKFIWDLPDKPRLEYLSLGREQLVGLGAKIANFEPPYDYLKNVQAGFDPEIRFLLNQCLAGDALACAARDEFVDREVNWFKGISLETNENAWQKFFTEHTDDLQKRTSTRTIRGVHTIRIPSIRDASSAIRSSTSTSPPR